MLDRTVARLNHLYLLAMMLVIAAIQTAALAMQFGAGELPCPLCLLQRVALFGVCFGVLLAFRHGDSNRATGLALLFAILLLVISVRQTLLDIYPRPGHAYIGSAVFGLHMPVWSVLIATALLIAFAIKLIGFGNGPYGIPVTEFPRLRRFATAAAFYVIVLAAINFGAVVVQCGVGECHTFGYRLLQPKP